MKKCLTMLGVFFCTTSALANDFHLDNYNLNGFDFAAPVVSGTSAVADKQVGMIIYDASSHQFKGLDDSGNWDSMTVSGSNQVTSSEASVRVERADLNTSSGGCSVPAGVGGLVSSCSRTTTGDFAISFTPGLFSGAPACTYSVGLASTSVVIGPHGSVTASGITNLYYLNGSGVNIDPQYHTQIICVGPR